MSDEIPKAIDNVLELERGYAKLLGLAPTELNLPRGMDPIRLPTDKTW